MLHKKQRSFNAILNIFLDIGPKRWARRHFSPEAPDRFLAEEKEATSGEKSEKGNKWRRVRKRQQAEFL